MDYKELTVEKLIVKTPTGKGRVEISGSAIVFYDGRSTPRMELSLDYEYGGPKISLRDACWQNRITLNVNSTGGANICLLHEHDRSAIWITTECGTRVNLFDEGGISRLDCYLDEDEGDPTIDLDDKQGHTRASLEIGGGGAGVIATYDAEGNEVWAAPAKEKKAPTSKAA